MSISGISGSSFTAPLQSSQTSGTRLEDRLQSLVSAVESGDLETSKESYNAVQEILPSGSSDGEDPVSQFLAAVENGLESGDVDSLREAAETFSSATAPEQQANADQFSPPPPPPPLLDEESADNLTNLIGALETEDIDSAQRSLEDLVSALGTSTDTSATQTDSNSLQEALTQISEALEAGDAETAQTTLQEALKGLPNGTLLVVEA